MDEKEFISELKQRNNKAFEKLIKQYQTKIINLCYGFVQNKDDSEDITQEVFIEIYNSIKNFKENSKIGTWVYRIAVNKSLDFLRKKKRKKQLVFIENLFGFGNNSDEETILSNITSDGELENKEKIKILNLALEKLPENQRIAFVLCVHENMSYEDISQVMGNTISAVESLIFRARTNLRKILSGYYNNKI